LKEWRKSTKGYVLVNAKRLRQSFDEASIIDTLRVRQCTVNIENCQLHVFVQTAEHMFLSGSPTQFTKGLQSATALKERFPPHQ